MPTKHEERIVRGAASMREWLPKLRDSGVPIPDTKVVEIRDWDAATTFTEGTPLPDDWVPIFGAIVAVDGPPAFVRTDQASDKHGMVDASRIPKGARADAIESHVKEVLRHNELAGFTGLPWRDIVVREWLDLSHRFKAFNGTPIADEIRVFIHGGDVVDYGWYWPADAIEKHHNHEPELPDDWRETLEMCKAEALGDFDAEVRPLAEQVAAEFEGYWSVDFARTTAGEWMCIDAAPGVASWHPETCERPDVDGLGLPEFERRWGDE